MPIFSNPKALALHQKARSLRVKVAVTRQFDAEAAEIKAAAIRLTSGGISEASLRNAGHPYARRIGSPKLKGKRQAVFGQAGIAPKLPINIQTGNLVRRWILPRFATGNEVEYRLSNTAAYGKYILAVGGTKRMIERPIWRRLRQLYRPDAIDRMRAAYRRAHET